jgi:aminomethyltransferase
MAYVQPDVAEPGTELTVDVRGQAIPARVVKLPFYKRRKE